MSRLTRYRPLAGLALAVYLGLLLWLFIFKDLSLFELSKERFRWRDLGLTQGHVNLVPGNTLVYYFGFREKYYTGALNIGGNLVAFLPFGVLLPVVVPAFCRLSRTMTAALVLSLGIEVFQVYSGAGDGDVDDLLLNAAGAGLGFLLLRFTLRLLLTNPKTDLPPASQPLRS